MVLDIKKHNGGYNPFNEDRSDNCGCSLGTFRKKRPMDSCSPNTYCPICPHHRSEKVWTRRRVRRQLQRVTSGNEYRQIERTMEQKF